MTNVHNNEGFYELIPTSTKNEKQQNWRKRAMDAEDQVEELGQVIEAQAQLISQLRAATSLAETVIQTILEPEAEEGTKVFAEGVGIVTEKGKKPHWYGKGAMAKSLYRLVCAMKASKGVRVEIDPAMGIFIGWNLDS